MKKIISIYAVLLFSLLSCNDKKENVQQQTDKAIISTGEKYAQDVNNGLVNDTTKKSVERNTIAMIDSNEIAIHYFSPGVRGRVIWGGLVPYDQVWVTGAHSATRISFTKDTRFAATTIPAGSYAIFSIPGKDKWTFILNKNFEQHLADDYKQEEDLVRVDILPELTKDTVQRLTYKIKSQGEGTGRIIINWETIQLSIPFVVLHTITGNGNAMSIHGKKLSGIKTDEKRDPVCYMPVTAGITDTTIYKKKVLGFCSAECKRLFINDPESYIAKALK